MAWLNYGVVLSFFYWKNIYDHFLFNFWYRHKAFGIFCLNKAAFSLIKPFGRQHLTNYYCPVGWLPLFSSAAWHFTQWSAQFYNKYIVKKILNQRKQWVFFPLILNYPLCLVAVTRLSCTQWANYEIMCIECTGECSFKDKADLAWLEFELSTSLKASRNSLKSMRPSLSMSMLFAKSSMESSGISELVCSLRRRHDCSNSSIEIKPDKAQNKIQYWYVTMYIIRKKVVVYSSCSSWIHV